jgi:hypothetical protein
VQVNGNGLAMSGDTLTVDNTVTPNTTEYHVVRYDAKGLVTAGRELISGDLPLASVGLVGAVYPGTGLTVSIDGELDHANTVAAGTATKVTFDTEGHITASDVLAEADIPNLPATKLTSGTIDRRGLETARSLGLKLLTTQSANLGKRSQLLIILGSSFLTQFQEISSFGTATYSSRLVSRLAKLFSLAHLTPQQAAALVWWLLLPLRARLLA